MKHLAYVVTAVWLTCAGTALAVSDGFFGAAGPGGAGCNCHGTVELQNTTTRLRIEGLPEAWEPGTPYVLDVYVLGIPLVGVGTAQLHDRLAGFNLEVSAGSLAPLDEDRSVKIRPLTECDFRRKASFPICSVGTNCGVEGPEPCRSVAECKDRQCSTPGEADCRACDDTVGLAAEATHTNAGSLGLVPPAEEALPQYADGNSRFRWRVRWTTPEAGRGDVIFYLAGNVVNGNHAADDTDVWSTLGDGALQDPLIVVPEGGAGD